MRVERWFDRIGIEATEVGSRMVDGRLDHRPVAKEESSPIDGLGIYVLYLNGEVVHIGRAKSVSATIRAHAALVDKPVPPWAPIKGIRFDHAEFYASHPDRIDADFDTIFRSLGKSKAA
jgi:hypothetical protein